MFGALGENTLHIFGACNILAIPIVWALYPESNQRTLEEMDLLFAADTPWNWDAEATFARLKQERPELAQAAHPQPGSGEKALLDPERGLVAVENVDL